MNGATRLFGVEHEQFILHDDGAAPTHDEINSLYRRFQTVGFRALATDHAGRCLGVARTTPWGELLVSTDCCTHILEFSFPPFAELADFRQMFVELSELCSAVLGELGLHIVAGGARQPPTPIHWRPKANDPDGSRLQAVLQRPPLAHPLYVAEHPAWIAATQVSLNLTRPQALPRLAHFYQFEPLVPVLFGNSPEMRGVQGRCLRPWSWLENFPPDFPLCGIPRTLPTTEAEYVQQRAACQGRDFSFVTLRNPQRLEFRSACSQPHLAAIEQLIRFRLAVDRLSVAHDMPSLEELRRQFIAACVEGPGRWFESLWERVVEVEPGLSIRAEERSPL